MTKKEFGDYLDNRSQAPADSADRELADLLAEVEILPDPEPGPVYWHRFDQRLQERLSRVPRRRRWTAHAFLGATLAAAAILLFFLLPHENEPRETPALESLDVADLALIDEAFAPLTDEPTTNLAEGDLEFLLDSLEETDGALYDAIMDVDPDDLMSLWEREG